MIDTSPVDMGPTEGDDDGLQEPAEASYEDLEAFLKNAKENESNDETKTDSTQPEKAADLPNNSETPVEPGKTETDPAAPKPEDSEPLVTKEQFEKQKKQLEQQEQFLKQRATEIGDLRRKVKEREAQLEALAEKAAEEGDLREAAKIDRAVEGVKEKDKELEAEAERVERLQVASQILPKYLRPEEFDLGAIRDELVEEGGLPPNVAQHFVDNIYEAAYPETIVWLGKLSFTKKVLKKVVSRALQLQEENNQLKTKAKNRGQQVMEGIKGALKTEPMMNSASSAANTPDRTPSADPSTWSNAQIDAFLKTKGKNG